MPGLRYRYRGADMKVQCRTPRMAELAKFMLAKKKADTSQNPALPDARADHLHRGQRGR